MTLFSENSEKDYISISRFIENFQANTNKELAIKDIIKLLTNQKIRFFVYVTGDQNEIKLSKRENAKSFPNNLYDLDIDYTEDEIRYCYPSDSNKSFYDNPNFKEVRNQEIIKKTSNINFYSMADKIANDITDNDFGFFKKVILLDKRIYFNGFFGIGFVYQFNDEFRATFEAIIKANEEFPLLSNCLSNDDTGLQIIHKGFYERSISNLEINYLQDLYLSKIDVERLTHDLNLLKPLDLTPPNNEIDELKKEIDELKERNRTLNLENKRLERELDRIKNDELSNADKHYQNLIIGLVYKFHDDYKKSRKRYFIFDRPNVSGIADNVIDVLTELNNRNIFNDDLYGKTILSDKLNLAFSALKLPKS